MAAPAPKEGFTFIELFAGVGGFRVGLEALGGRCIWSTEKNKPARATYAANFGPLPYHDATLADYSRLPDYDVLTAGFPCQDFTTIGGQAGLEGSRGTLFYQVVRAIRESRPAGLLLENVRGLVTMQDGAIMRAVLTALRGEGYDVSYRMVNSNCLVPQYRARVYIVGVRRDDAPPRTGPTPRPAKKGGKRGKGGTVAGAGAGGAEDTPDSGAAGAGAGPGGKKKSKQKRGRRRRYRKSPGAEGGDDGAQASPEATPAEAAAQDLVGAGRAAAGAGQRPAGPPEAGGDFPFPPEPVLAPTPEAVAAARGASASPAPRTMSEVLEGNGDPLLVNTYTLTYPLWDRVRRSKSTQRFGLPSRLVPLHGAADTLLASYRRSAQSFAQFVPAAAGSGRALPPEARRKLQVSATERAPTDRHAARRIPGTTTVAAPAPAPTPAPTPAPATASDGSSAEGKDSGKGQGKGQGKGKAGSAAGLDVGVTHRPRWLTPRECHRLMGFPETFRAHLSDPEAYHQMGNAVTPPIIALLGGAVLAALPHVRAPPVGWRAAGYGAAAQLALASTPDDGRRDALARRAVSVTDVSGSGSGSAAGGAGAGGGAPPFAFTGTLGELAARYGQASRWWPAEATVRGDCGAGGTKQPASSDVDATSAAVAAAPEAASASPPRWSLLAAFVAGAAVGAVVALRARR